VVFTDKKTLQLKATIRFEHLERMTNLQEVTILEVLAENKDLDDLQAFIPKDKQSKELIWKDMYDGRPITTVSFLE
jgi:hypothetical protein